MCIEIAGARPMLPKVRILIGFDARQTGSQQQRLLCNEKCARGRLFIVGKATIPTRNEIMETLNIQRPDRRIVADERSLGDSLSAQRQAIPARKRCGVQNRRKTILGAFHDPD